MIQYTREEFSHQYDGQAVEALNITASNMNLTHHWLAKRGEQIGATYTRYGIPMDHQWFGVLQFQVGTGQVEVRFPWKKKETLEQPVEVCSNVLLEQTEVEGIVERLTNVLESTNYKKHG